MFVYHMEIILNLEIGLASRQSYSTLRIDQMLCIPISVGILRYAPSEKWHYKEREFPRPYVYWHSLQLHVVKVAWCCMVDRAPYRLF